MFIDNDFINGQHISADIETTALHCSEGVMTSFSAVAFNPFVWNEKPHLLAHAKFLYDYPILANIETLQWREENVKEYKLPEMWPLQFMQYLNIKISNWSSGSNFDTNVYWWFWHAHFDVPFFEALYRKEGKMGLYPINYFNVVDIPSFLKGMGEYAKKVKQKVVAEGGYNKHNPDDDAMLQADCVRLVIKGKGAF